MVFQSKGVSNAIVDIQLLHSKFWSRTSGGVIDVFSIDNITTWHRVYAECKYSFLGLNPRVAIDFYEYGL